MHTEMELQPGRSGTSAGVSAVGRSAIYKGSLWDKHLDSCALIVQVAVVAAWSGREGPDPLLELSEGQSRNPRLDQKVHTG